MTPIEFDKSWSVDGSHGYQRVYNTSTTSDIDCDLVSQPVKVDAARAILRTWKTAAEDASSLNAPDARTRSARTVLKSSQPC